MGERWGVPVGTERVAADDTAEALAVFAGAAHARPRRRLRLAAGLVAAGFAVVSLTVVSTHDRTEHAGGGSVLAEAPVDAGGPGTVVPTPADQVTEVLGPLAPALGLTPSDVSSFGSAAGASEPGGDETGDAVGPGAPAAAGDPNVAVITPVLKVFAFGSKVGLPLLCNVAFSAVIAQLPDPNLAQLATTIVTSCVTNGVEGGAALVALNQQLTALEAINPAVAPLVDALVATFNAAGAPGVPFSQSLIALGDLIAYFSSTSS